MLDTLFRRRHRLLRLRANPLGPLMDRLAESLVRRGHAAYFCRAVLRAAEHFGYWLGTRHPAAAVEEATTASARDFLDQHMPACSCPVPFPRARRVARVALNHLLRLLGRQGLARQQASGPHDALLAEYGRFLRRACGLADQTCIYRLRYAREFVQRLFGDGPAEFSRLRPADFQDYFRRHAAHLKPRSAAVMADSLRGFLRFLALSGGIDPALAGAIPTAPCWPKDRLPRALPEPDLRAVLAYFDLSTATGLRDRAMIWCMSDLGLRVSEVAALTLGDVDWRQGTVKVPAGKSRRARLLPLPAALGEAITAYLRRGRPPSAGRHLFLRHTAPAGTPVTPSLIRDVFRSAHARATGRDGSIGTHVLRHAAAARMRAAGEGLKGIADVLGHRSVDTTSIYVKLDVEALRGVALPWPGGEA